MIKKRIFILTSGLFIALSTVAPISAGATAITPKLNGRIVISSTEGPGGQDLFSKKADGTDPVQLTTSASNVIVQTPAFSPDNKKIAYSSSQSGSHDIWIMNSDGSNKQLLADSGGYDAWPTWSPDGSKIAFTGQSGNGKYTLYTMNPDGTALTALSNNGTTIDDFGPSWSPDGTKLAFMRLVQGQVPQVYTYNFAGTSFTKISNFANGTSGGRNAYWSPDGTKIITGTDAGDQYTVNDPFLGTITRRHFWIYIMNADGSNTQAVNYCQNSDSFDPIFSPDGSKLLFITECGTGGRHAVVTDVDGSNPINVGYSGQGELGVPAWQALPLSSSTTDGQGTTTNTVEDDQEASDYDVSDDNSTNKTIFVVNGKVGQVNVNSNGVLKGHGTIVMGVTVKSGGKLAPGQSPGCISSGGLTLNSGATYEVEIAGNTACTEYDQTIVTGAVDLGSSTLNTLLLNNFVGKQGDQFKIIDNDGSDPVTGTFNGLAEGATFTVGGTQFRISYVGGDGNDVVLTIVNSPVPASNTGILGVPNTGLKLILANPILMLVITFASVLGIARIARRIG